MSAVIGICLRAAVEDAFDLADVGGVGEEDGGVGGEFTVLRDMVAPLRPSMTPWIFVS